MTHNPLAGWTGTPLFLWEGAASTMAGHLATVARASEARRTDSVLSRLGQALRLSASAEPPPELKAEAPHFLTNPARHEGGFFIADRVAYTTISGPLERTGCWWGEGYDRIAQRVSIAFDDPDVDGVFVSIDSPGGHASGMLECAQRLRSLADEAGKPLHAHAPALIASAAYGLGVAADTLTVDSDAICGSVGVVMLHADMSKMLEDWGITLTSIQHGEKKTDGNFWQPLSDRARNDLQTMINDLGDRFTSHVADRRGMDQSAVIDWQAGVQMGPRAVTAGMADDVATEPEAFAALVASLSGASGNLTERDPAGAGATSQDGRAPSNPKPKQQKDADMTLRAQMAAIMQGEGTAEEKNTAMQALLEANDEPDTDGDEPEAAGDDEADADGDEPDATDDDDEADAEADDADAATAGAIITLPEAKGRADYAVELAQTPGMTVKAAKNLLAKAPKTKAGQLAGKMSGQDPTITTGTGKSGANDNPLVAIATSRKASARR
ncbi:MAG: S49 family peptidase [Pseudomonadota bacterium]